jgi:hypothetical protein
VQVDRDESVNHFKPDVDPLAGEDAIILDRLSQEVKGINISMPPSSQRFNPYLPENHSNNRPMDAIEIQNDIVASPSVVLTPQVQVKIGPGTVEQQKEISSIDDEDINRINSKTANIKITQMISSPQTDTTHASEDSETTMDTNDALWNAIDDGSTQSFGTDISNGDASEKEGE